MSLLRKDGGAIRNFALRAEFGGPAREKGCLCRKEVMVSVDSKASFDH